MQVATAYMGAGPHERRDMDVRADLKQAIEQAYEAEPHHAQPELTPQWRQWCARTKQDVEVGDDEDLVISKGGEFKNMHCVLTQKSIFELDEAVEDSRGNIWEKAAIVQHIKSSRGGIARNPASNSNEPITMGELKPARRVMREAALQKRRKQQETHDAEEVL